MNKGEPGEVLIWGGKARKKDGKDQTSTTTHKHKMVKCDGVRVQKFKSGKSRGER